jgi:predicted alpha/beta-fold hydrolase
LTTPCARESHRPALSSDDGTHTIISSHATHATNHVRTDADLIVPHGYPLEEHFVTTADGYILRMFRIPHGAPGSAGHASCSSVSSAGRRQHRQLQLQPPWSTGWKRPSLSDEPQRPLHTHAHACKRPAVHLQHGLLGSSTDWVLNGPGLSLPLLLADAGWDVWLGNVRGNVFSRNHTSLGLLDPAFWAFSWDDMAAHDLPAMMTYALLAGGGDWLAYVGHSQGTTLALAMLSAAAGSALVERVRVSACVFCSAVCRVCMCYGCHGCYECLSHLPAHHSAPHSLT